jgi:aspartate kinase
MLELASLGAKVLQIRSVEIAMKYNVPIHVRSSFNDQPGTLVTGEDAALEGAVVSGVAYDKSEARVHVVGVDDRPGMAADLFEKIAEKNISVDMIVQNVTTDANQRAAITFTLGKTDLARAKESIEAIAKGVGAREVRYDEDVVKVSIVGSGMRSHAGVAAKMFRLLASEGINIQAISTSEIRVSCLVASKYTELAVRALHDGFGLNKVKAE